MLVFLDRGLSFFVIGLLIACRDVTVNVLEIPSGVIADSFGRRRSMMVSFVAYIISFLVLGSATNLAWLFVGMFLYGVGDTFRTGTHKAMIFEWLRIHGRGAERTRIYGLTRSWSQIGSAVCGVIAAGFILVSGNYQYVFYFAIVPYVINLINFAGYPSELDGDHEKPGTLSEVAVRLKRTLWKAIANPRLRRVIVESMGWGGYLGAVKDYLQPVLQTASIAAAAYFMGQSFADRPDGSSWLNEARTTALLIGPVYMLLFLMSAWASRNSHRVVEKSGNEIHASNRLWLGNAILFLAIGVFGFLNWSVVLIIAFVLLQVLGNLWRPILISRFDKLSDPDEGATILSIESQATRTATFLVAPLIGWAIDSVRENNWGGEFWPIGLVGGVIAIWMYVSQTTGSPEQPEQQPG